MPATDPEQVRRTLNHWNATRHGWSRFQAGTRRAAERIAFADPAADLDPITTQSEPTGPAATDRSLMDPRASIHAMFATDDETAAKLDALLNQYRKDVAEFVLEAVEYAAGDDTAEHVKDSSPTLEAWLDGRDAD
ncbi:hypothetical protein ACFW5V_28625 [Streptomyces sp. NPDC058762]|uniref:hypothetical protein n=1 Tax=Streptomyces sp. NPDC058762 TaxID=3346629 RepID=UPI0036911D8A